MRDITATGDIVAAAGDELVILPAAYCADHVQLAYATTAHRSQGRTVDTAHTIVGSSASRETFYVAMTRGKHSNRAYVVVDEDGQLGDQAATGMSRTWRETLEHVILNRGGDIAAHDTLTVEADRIGSIRQLAAEHQTLVADQLEREYLPVLGDLALIGPQSPESPYLGPVLANLRRVESRGENVPTTISRLLAERYLGDARDKLAVLHYRLASHLEERAEIDYYVPYAFMLDEHGVDLAGPGGKRTTLRLYRALSGLAQRGFDVRTELQNALAGIDRASTCDLPARLTRHFADAFEIPLQRLQEPPSIVRGELRGDLVAGIIERAPDFRVPDFTRVLHDRELAIQLRAEMLVDQAQRDGAPWLQELGDPITGDVEGWRRRAVIVACYRDLYGVDTEDALGREHTQARNRERDWRIAASNLPARLRRSTPEMCAITSAQETHAERVTPVTF